MQRIALIVVLLFIPFIVACGKFADKFSRINGSFTQVHLSDRSRHELTATVDGGLMIYFVEEGNPHQGRSFGFTSSEAASGASVMLPNGQYRVYAYGWDGASIFTGQARCGRGDNGALITLGGSSTTVTLNMDPAHCQFGTSNAFGAADHAISGNTNFDTMNLEFCTGSPYPSCTVNATGTYYMKAELIGGARGPVGVFSEVPVHTLSACSATSGSGTFSTSLRLPIGGSVFSPPMKLSFYTASQCTGTASGTYLFMDGIKQYFGASTGTSYVVDVATSSSTFSFRINKYF